MGYETLQNSVALLVTYVDPPCHTRFSEIPCMFVTSCTCKQFQLNSTPGTVKTPDSQPEVVPSRSHAPAELPPTLQMYPSYDNEDNEGHPGEQSSPSLIGI